MLQTLITSLLLYQTVEAVPCSAANRLTLFFLNETVYPTSRCADGTNAGFYLGRRIQEELGESDIDQTTFIDRDFVIWLGDVDSCTGEECDEVCEGSQREAQGEGVCEGVSTEVLNANDGDVLDEGASRCLFSRATCTSSWWDTFATVTPETILCQDEANVQFRDFVRVFIPSCSLDFWLGDNPTEDDFKFRGTTIFDSVIDSLINGHNLTRASRIVFGGTRFAGVAAMHHTTRLRDILEEAGASPTIFTIVDSGWVNVVENLGNKEMIVQAEIQRQTQDWIADSSIIDSCRSFWTADDGSTTQLYKCLIPLYLLSTLVTDFTYRILFLQSDYDLVALDELGLSDASVDSDEFADSASFAQAGITFVENFGQVTRNGVEVSNPSPRIIKFYEASCGQNGLVLPTRVHSIDPTTQEISNVGSVLFKRDETAYTELSVNNESPQSTITLFVSTNGLSIQRTGDTTAAVNRDDCGSFLCNANCETEVFPFETTRLVSVCVQRIVLVYAFFAIVISCFFFSQAYLRVRIFRYQTKKFWSKIMLISADNGTNFKSSEHDADFEVLQKIADQRNQTADEVQEQLILSSSAFLEYRRVHLMASNLSYTTPSLSAAHPSKKILHEVNLEFQPGKVHAIMGPSGSGKSTLLELLSFTRSSGSISGSIYANGVDLHSPDKVENKRARFLHTWFKFNSAFVSQDDYFFPTLTVRETLEHAAFLILPEYLPDNEKLHKVYQLLNLLDLSGCADTLCGDGGVAYEGGISGGQRRRLSVAVQLLLNPSAIFLDEPTSGLDSVSALNLVRRLKVFAEKADMNVILTIHQPRREIFEQIDTLSLLVLGRVVFSGTIPQAKDFFDMNIVGKNFGDELLDRFMRVVDGNDPLLQEHINKFEQSAISRNILSSMASEKTSLTEPMAQEMKELLVHNALAEGRYSYSSPSSMFYLQWVLISRTLKRNGLNLITSMVLSLLAGLTLGGLFYQADSYEQLTGGIYLIIATITFIQGVFLGRRYFDEKLMYDHEYRAGTLKSWEAFLFAQFVKDGTTTLLECLCFGIPAYLLAGLELDLTIGFNFLVIISLVGLATTSLNVLIQIDRNNVRAAGTLQVAFVALGSLFNGFIIPLNALPVYYKWLPYCMVAFYGLVAVTVNQYAGFTLPCDTNVLECLTRTGDVVIRTLEFNDIDIFFCVLMLLVLVLVFRLASIADFYARYVGISTLKIETKSNQFEPTVPQADPSQPIEVGGTMRDMIGHSKRNVELRNAKAPENPKADQTQNVDSYADDDDYYEDEDEVKLIQTGIQGILLSRTFIALLFFVDLLCTPYVCATSDLVLTLISLSFLGMYAMHFINQLAFLIPFTAGGSSLDFVWAAEWDGASLALFVVDLALVVLSNPLLSGMDVSENETIALALVVKVIRLFRVQVYWNKVSKGHKLRAHSFLQQRKQLLEEHMKDQVSTKRLNKSMRNSGWVAGMRSLNKENARVSMNLRARPVSTSSGNRQYARDYSEAAGWKKYTSHTGVEIYFNSVTGESVDARIVEGLAPANPSGRFARFSGRYSSQLHRSNRGPSV